MSWSVTVWQEKTEECKTRNKKALHTTIKATDQSQEWMGLVQKGGSKIKVGTK